jgi:hypothetical protein
LACRGFLAAAFLSPVFLGLVFVGFGVLAWSPLAVRRTADVRAGGFRAVLALPAGLALAALALVAFRTFAFGRGAAFFLRVVRETAFLAEARRVLDLAIARLPFSRRRLTKRR